MSSDYDFYEQEVMNLATAEEIDQEATRRLSKMCNLYRLSPKIMENWEEGIMSCSSETVHGAVANARRIPPYDLPNTEKAAAVIPVPPYSNLADVIADFEQEYGFQVYYVLQNAFFLTMLFVDPYVDEWAMFDKDEIPEGYFTAYVFNLWSPKKSEIGYVQLRSVDGVMVRVI